MPSERTVVGDNLQRPARVHALLDLGTGWDQASAAGGQKSKSA